PCKPWSPTTDGPLALSLGKLEGRHPTLLRGLRRKQATRSRHGPMEKIIEIKHVTVYRERTRVFDDLSLEITQGCNTAILGPNGAGKTTLLQLLLREIYPVHRVGSYVRLFGREQWNVWALRRHFGIVSHDLQQAYVGNARGLNVILSGYYSSIDTRAHRQFSAEDITRAHHIMRTLGVAALQDRPFSAMSTGEQRRFLLGRALVHD